MSIDPQVIHAETHGEIGYILQRHVEEVLQRWSTRAAQEQPHAKRVHHDVLLNKLFDFLKTLGRSLAEAQNPDGAPHRLIAAIHGEQRWESGWSLAELIRDYQILRLVILEFLEENLERPLDHREVLAIGLVLDEAISTSTAMYMKGRDDHIREIQEQRAKEAEQLQQRLRDQADALREANRRKSEYLAVLAHELRNHLAPIRNGIQILKLKSAPDPDLQWPHDIIERQVEQMSRIVDDLLDTSRINLAKLKLEKQQTDLTTIVKRAIEVARPFIDAKKHQFTVALPSELIYLEVDVGRMTQVFVNLLTNAAKYTDDGGQVWLSAQRQGDEAVVKLRDSGIGIPADMLARIFDPFAQDEHSNEHAPGGLGIGLTLARSLVDLHGGRIQVFSAGRGQGAEFVVHLPTAVAVNHPMPDEKTQATTG
jgi:signal transduction histidine kinase